MSIQPEWDRETSMPGYGYTGGDENSLETMEFRITERALERLHQTALDEAVNLDSTLLRVAVVPGGCSGLTYELGWDTSVEETDSVVDLDILRLVVDRRSELYLDGTELDFTDGLEGKGFHFHNPQATRSCACGESFGV